MARTFARVFYRCLISLHPRSFREQFGGEMLWIFDEVTGAREVVALFSDALLSLLRQWLVRWAFQRFHGDFAFAPLPPSAQGFFAWERIAFSARPLAPQRVLEGAMVSLASLALINFGLFPPTRVTRAQRLYATGGYASNHQAEPAGGKRARAFGQGARELPSWDFRKALRGDFSYRTQSGDKSPDPPAARQFSAWLEAFNSGDRAALLDFLQRNDPSHAGHLDGEMAFRAQTGGFDIKRVEQSDTTKFVGIVKERDSDQFARFVLEVEQTEPHHITQFDLRAIAAPAGLAPARMSEADALAALRAEIEKNAHADRFAGAVLVAKDGQSIFTEACGLADREKKIPNKLTTQFRIGSMNKMFTAVSVLQLVQAGKLNLNDPLGKYLTDYPNKDVASKVTLHHLLTHSGGTGDFFGPEFDKHRLELRTLEDYVKLYGQRGLAFEPGSRWEYSNYGFLLLGVVVEKVSGQSYYDYVAQHVYKPAGMTSTASLAEDQSVPNRSVGYTKFGGGSAWHPNTDTLPYRGTSAGGGYSTVEDLLRFANALQNHKLLDAQHTELLTTGKLDTPNGEKYAYGFGDSSVNGVRCFGHGGGAPGMNGDLQICPQSGYVVAVLANLDPPSAQRIATFAVNRLPAK